MASFTEKIDGSSLTVYQINGKFGVCSRNIDLAYDNNDKYLVQDRIHHHGIIQAQKLHHYLAQ